MKRIIILALFACASVCGLKAQVVDTTVCAIMQNPTSFDGKIVRVKGIAVGGLDNFIMRPPSGCNLARLPDGNQSARGTGSNGRGIACP